MFKLLIMKYRNIKPGQDDFDRRLDRVVRKSCPTLSLSEVYKHLRKGDIRVNGKKKKPDYRLCPEDILEICEVIPAPAASAPAPVTSSSRELSPSSIIYEDSDLLLVNKPAGLLVHGLNSLDDAVSTYLLPRGKNSLSFKPGPLHRLDRNTSGVVTFGKSLKGARQFTENIQSGGIKKYYLALVDGSPPGEGRWSDYLTRDNGKTLPGNWETGKLAELYFRRLLSTDEKSLILVRLITGRTHQIRAQAALHGYPLWGDVKYGGQSNRNRYFLHAWILKADGMEIPPVSAPLPSNFNTILGSIFPKKKVLSRLSAEQESIFLNKD